MRILLISSSVGALGAGALGGVETIICDLERELDLRGHQVGILAVSGSEGRLASTRIHSFDGVSPVFATTRDNYEVTLTHDGAVESMCRQVAQIQDQYDVMLSFSFDALAYYLTPMWRTPIGHFVSICATGSSTDRFLSQAYQQSPANFRCNSHTQARTFGLDDMAIIPPGVDTDVFHPDGDPDRDMLWVGRISPEKGLEDALEVSRRTGLHLDIYGVIQDIGYWERLQREYPDAHDHYRGHLPHTSLASVYGRYKLLLHTPRYVEAFGMVCVEAMACGTPVVTYAKGGPRDIILPGISGYLVSESDHRGLIDAVRRASSLDRDRVAAAAHPYALSRMVQSYIDWCSTLLS